MARRAAVDRLPTDIRDELTEKLVANGFSDYTALAEWLAEKGHAISRSALHRFGADLEAEFESATQDARRSIELARAMRANGNSDEDGSLLDASSSILQDQLLRISLALRKVDVDPQEAVELVSKASRALADLGRMSISNKKWQAEREAEIREEERAKAADTAAQVAKDAGVSPETIAAMRRALGMQT
jgi:hypothetical protein